MKNLRFDMYSLRVFDLWGDWETCNFFDFSGAWQYDDKILLISDKVIHNYTMGLRGYRKLNADV